MITYRSKLTIFILINLFKFYITLKLIHLRSKLIHLRSKLIHLTSKLIKAQNEKKQGKAYDIVTRTIKPVQINGLTKIPSRLNFCDSIYIVFLIIRESLYKNGPMRLYDFSPIMAFVDYQSRKLSWDHSHGLSLYWLFWVYLKTMKKTEKIVWNGLFGSCFLYLG